LGIARVGTLDANYRERSLEGTRYGLAVRLSGDQGRTWGNRFELQDPQGVKFNARRLPGSPDLVNLPDGKVLIVFYSPQQMNVKRGFYLAANILAFNSPVAADR
jgi:hypothetical protein